MPEDPGTLRQQIGETLGAVRSVIEQLAQIRADADRREDRIANEIRAIKQDQREVEQATSSQRSLLSGKLSDVEAQMRSVMATVARFETEMVAMRVQLDAVKNPLQQMRNYAVVLIGVGVVIWNILGPFLQQVAVQWIGGSAHK